MATTANAVCAVLGAAAALLALLARERARHTSQPLLDRSRAVVQVLQPGLVLIRGALPMAAQLRIARDVFEYGHGSQHRRWWSEEELTAEAAAAAAAVAAASSAAAADSASQPGLDPCVMNPCSLPPLHHVTACMLT